MNVRSTVETLLESISDINGEEQDFELISPEGFEFMNHILELTEQRFSVIRIVSNDGEAVSTAVEKVVSFNEIAEFA